MKKHLIIAVALMSACLAQGAPEIDFDVNENNNELQLTAPEMKLEMGLKNPFEPPCPPVGEERVFSTLNCQA